MPHCQACPDRFRSGFDPILGCSNIALWEFQVRHQGELPSQPEQAVELESIQATLINERITNKSLLKGLPKELIAFVRLLSI